MEGCHVPSYIRNNIELYYDDIYSEEMFRFRFAYPVLHIPSNFPNIIEFFGLNVNSGK